VVILACNIWEHGPMASAVAPAYNGSLETEPPTGSRGSFPLKLKHFWFLDVQWKPQIFPLLYNLKTQRNRVFVLYLQKIIAGYETGNLEQNWGMGLCPRPGPKTATAQAHRPSRLERWNHFDICTRQI